MRRCEQDDKGLSPVVGVLLMISITVSLSGVVYLMASSYTEMAHGGIDIFSIKAKLYTKGIKETDVDGSPTGITYSGVKIEVMSGSLVWGNYRVLIDNERVFTVGSDTVLKGSVPDGNSEPIPSNHGMSRAGAVQWFSEEGFRSDLTPLSVHRTYDLRLVDLRSNSVAWQVELTANV